MKFNAEANASRKTVQRHLILVLVVAIVMRLFIGLSNTRANDDHVIVSDLISKALISEQGSPPYDACATCYHPRLFHFTATLPCIVGKACNPETARVFGQLFNSLLSCLLVVGVLQWLRAFVTRQWVQLIVFVLVAFNPRLVLVGAQASTDMPAIFFSFVCAYYWHLFLVGKSRKHLALVFCALVLSFLSKGTAMALFGGIAVSLAMTLRVERNVALNRTSLGFVLGILISTVGTIALFPDGFAPYGRYFQQMVSSGRPGAVNFGKNPHVPFIERQYVSRPGVISIVDSFLTFRIVDMIKHPWITQGYPPVPFHRTSFWSQLYGRYHFIFFDQWPFERTDRWSLLVGRASLVLGFLPTMVWVVGVISFISCLFKMRHKKTFNTWINHGGCVVPIAFAYLAVLIAFNYSYRGFDAMKDVYMLPGFLGYLVIFVRGIRCVNVRFRHSPKLMSLVRINLWLLAFAYLGNYALMMQYLLKQNLP